VTTRASNYRSFRYPPAFELPGATYPSISTADTQLRRQPVKTATDLPTAPRPPPRNWRLDSGTRAYKPLEHDALAAPAQSHLDDPIDAGALTFQGAPHLRHRHLPRRAEMLVSMAASVQGLRRWATFATNKRCCLSRAPRRNSNGQSRAASPAANRSKIGTPNEKRRGDEKLVQHEHHGNAAEKGETANIKQNTTYAGYFKGRRMK
jgi:hypothetical protein